jgi:pimeloyl-ACP methyl ester carboxylesterase
MGRVYREIMPNCHLVLVYDAGHAIERERPEAFASLLGDFVTRGGREFLAPPESTLITP